MERPKRERSTVIDDHVSARIHERRIMLGLSLRQLADPLGIPYQQAQKYERGINRVTAGRLFEISRVLGVPVGYFYEGIGEESVRPVPHRERMVLEITRNFADITDERHQQALIALTRALASTH